jgi:hypothetical protein
LITIKRKHISLAREDRYGHWWFEIGDADDADSESYGWWPGRPVGLREALAGVAGELNGQTTFRGRPTRDPHHGDDADEEFHPVVPTSDGRTDGEIAECLRDFARSYHGVWEWKFGKGQNCHTFQDQAMKHCRLRKQPPKNWV